MADKTLEQPNHKPSTSAHDNVRRLAQDANGRP
jgi:hypothetical protein